MLSSFTEFIRNWGYIAVLFGSMVEGESVVLTASALAAGGFLSIYKIFWISFLATVVADQSLYWVGRKIGTNWLVKRFPRLKKARDKGFNLLKKMDIFFIFAFRFIYGIRTISPLIIGAAHIKPVRFAVYNFLSGLCWALIVCAVGYTIADVVMDGEFDTKSTVLIVSCSIIVFPVVAALIVRMKDKKGS